ncbi:nucleobase:cation symporter-2 family protein [Bacillus massiliigorillae]|uniref:nucleobase:cation symporter-2 family protein n=1 Tax=Bacillus massiliigorillae TaxID=1243664 RepID=UPI00227FDCA9|nr:nucleobase:cation symporter-2 family protein [Bacillus massiliigorillae]
MKSNSNIFKIGSLGIQHVLAMYAGAILVPLIVGGALGLDGEQLTYLVSIDILTSGIATLLQVYSNKFTGIGLPIMLGCTFTAVPPMISIGGEYGISSIYGSIIVSGIIVVLISTFFGKLVRFFPPVVTGSVVTIIGITLIPVAINNLAGGDQGAPDFASSQNILLGFGTLLIIILLYKFSSGFLRAISVLIGIIVGTVAAYFMGMLDFTEMTNADWFHLPKPFYFGVPTFEITPIIIMTLVAIVSLVESTGVYFALGDICDKEIKEKDLVKGYRAEGLASVIGGLFNAFPYTTFSQNVGLLQITGVKSKKVIYAAVMFLVILGLIPKMGALATIIPTSVLGGAMVAMFGMVATAGIKMLSRVNFDRQENMFIIAISIGLGLGVTVVPDLFKSLPSNLAIITNSGIVMGSLSAIFLNILFNMIPGKKKAMLEENQAKKVS